MIDRRRGERRYRWEPVPFLSPSGERKLYLPLQWQAKSCTDAYNQRRHGEANYDSHKHAATLYALDRRRAVRAPRYPAMKALTDGTIVFKCDDPQCHQYVQSNQLTRKRVMLTIDDPAKPKGVSMVMVERDLCPHCFVLSSRSGTQEFNPTPAGFARSKSDNIWKPRDRRLSSEVDPKSFEELRGRFKK
jgi:hypothetical protein